MLQTKKNETKKGGNKIPPVYTFSNIWQDQSED